MSDYPVLAAELTAAAVYSDENYADTVAAQARVVADGEARTRNIKSNEAVNDGWRGGPQAGFDRRRSWAPRTSRAGRTSASPTCCTRSTPAG